MTGLAIRGSKRGHFDATLGNMQATAQRLIAATGLLALLAGCRTAPAPPPEPPTAAIATEYDLIYAISHAKMPQTPSPFLAALVARLKLGGGTALDLGGGAGRNSIFLAQHGFAVTDVDVSRVGLDLAQQRAERQHLRIATVAADINQFDLGRNRWDLIALIDFPFPYRALLPRIAAGLKPGGVVVIQAVAQGQPGLESPDKVLHYTFMARHDLDAPFAGFAILHNTLTEEPTVWGVKARMVRYAARKP
jgi:SAM-dependent methyltransferase